MGNSDSSQPKNSVRLSKTVQARIKQIAYEHGMSFEDAKTQYQRMLRSW